VKTYTVQPAGELVTNESGKLVDAKGAARSPDSLKAESLKDVAKKTGASADDIFAANREVIGSNPANLPLGAQLVIPDKNGGK
jgi:hypothetical protein